MRLDRPIRCQSRPPPWKAAGSVQSLVIVDHIVVRVVLLPVAAEKKILYSVAGDLLAFDRTVLPGGGERDRCKSLRATVWVSADGVLRTVPKVEEVSQRKILAPGLQLR